MLRIVPVVRSGLRSRISQICHSRRTAFQPRRTHRAQLKGDQVSLTAGVTLWCHNTPGIRIPLFTQDLCQDAAVVAMARRCPYHHDHCWHARCRAPRSPQAQGAAP
jgi:hypothetical protein